MGRNIGGTNKDQQSKGQNTFGLAVSSQNSRMSNQQHINRTSGGATGPTNPSAANDYLNGLIQVSNHRNDGGMKIQGHILQNITKRSQSQHSHQPPAGAQKIANAANANLVSGKKSQMKPQMNNSLFGGSNDGGLDAQHLNTQQFVGGPQPEAPGGLGGVGSRGHHKRPKSNLDGFFKSSKGAGPMQLN